MKRTNLIYWIVTGLFAAFMLFSSIPDVILSEEAKTFMNGLGYPDYFTRFIGVVKVLGVIAILVPGYPRIKEWAYAGFFFNMFGAVYSHLASGSEPKELFGPILLLVLIVVSWYFRPADRKIIVNQ